VICHVTRCYAQTAPPWSCQESPDGAAAAPRPPRKDSTKSGRPDSSASAPSIRTSPPLGQLYAVIETARHGHSWGDLKRRSASRERREKYQADHAGLVAALRARDSDRATEAMRTHLSRVNNDLFGETA
jgi:FCD domain